MDTDAINKESSEAAVSGGLLESELLPLQQPRVMPDIASESAPAVRGRLDRVGMERIETPVILMRDGQPLVVSAQVDVSVSLDDEHAKGVHMSRMFLTVQRHLDTYPLDGAMLQGLLEELVSSHAGLSTRASIRISFEWLEKRQALRSPNAGWRRYPIVVEATLGERLEVQVSGTIVYSSTCPCSAALARQLIQEQFERDLEAGLPLTREAVLEWLGSEQGIVATPHSQRSEAQVTVRLSSPDSLFSPGSLGYPGTLIERLEGAVRTVVQAAVKREDEQAFALLNGQNLMFCEDAARRLAAVLETSEVSDFRVRAAHYESLHPHDAVAIVTKGIPGGLVP